MRIYLLVLLVFLAGCGDDDNFFEEPSISTVCTTPVEDPDLSVGFQVLIDGDLWQADSALNVRLFDNDFVLTALSKKEEGEFTRLKFEIKNAREGINEIDFNSDNSFFYEVISDQVVNSDKAVCAYVNFSKLDDTGKKVSGTFQADINARQTEPTNVDITKGVFNDLDIDPLFCPVEFEIVSGELDVFNDWRLLGIFDTEGGLVSDPPCGSFSSVKFERVTENNRELIRISGQTVLNEYFAEVFNLDNTRFSTADFGITTNSGLQLETIFEGQFIQVLANAEVTYFIEDNVLIISNSQIGRQIKLVLL